MGRKRPNAQPANFRARKQKSGETYYYFDTGARPRKEIPLGPNLLEALQKYAKLTQDGWEAPKSRPATFADAAERYMAEVVPKKAAHTQIGNKLEMKRLLEVFDNPPAPLDLITPRHVRKYMDLRDEAPVRANREKALLSHVFNKAREWGLTSVANPCAGVRSFRETGRSIYIEESVYLAVYDGAEQILKDAMEIAYLTAQRPSDVMKLQQTDIVNDKGGGQGLRVKQDKTGKHLTLAMTQKGTNELNALGQLVKRLIDSKTNHPRPTLSLFCRRSGQPMTQTAMAQRFARARKRAVAKILASAERASSALERQELKAFAESVKQFQFRDLRAKAGTDTANTKGDIRKAQLQLGHSSVQMTEAYIRRRGADRIEPTE